MKSKRVDQEEEDVLRQTEEIIADASSNITRSIKKGPKCLGDKVLLNSFNCLSGMGFNVSKMEGDFSTCLDNASTDEEVDNCVSNMKRDIVTLKKKLGKGHSCNLVSFCKKNPDKKITTTPATSYCLAHVGPGVARKCIKKVKDGSIQKMDKKDIDLYMKEFKHPSSE